MKTAETVFVIPTYRLRDVTETIETYDEHFWSNGHSVKMIVLDDSSLANHEKYFSRLEHTKTTNELYYVGPREKEQFLSFLNKKLRDRKLETLVRNLFRPSYGGNRNFTLMYTLGAFMVSVDDDMRPHALVEGSPESLAHDEVCRGRLHKAGTNGCVSPCGCGADAHQKQLYAEPSGDGCFQRRDLHTVSLVALDDLSIRFGYQGEVNLQDSEEILEKITAVHAKVLKAVFYSSTILVPPSGQLRAEAQIPRNRDSVA